MDCFDLSDFYHSTDLTTAFLIDYYIKNIMSKNNGHFEINWPKDILYPSTTDEWFSICQEFGFTKESCEDNYHYILTSFGYKLHNNHYIRNKPLYLAYHGRYPPSLHVNIHPCPKNQECI